jgi:riboflavin kinase/FMN adenylyltransferase
MGAAPLVFVDDATPLRALDTSPSVLVIGNFDGVHRGHRAVLESAVAEARGAGLVAYALTFDPHPSRVVGGDRPPPLLTTLERRAELIGALGISRVFVRRFDATFAAWSPERFVRDLVVGALAARRVVVGADFRFGAKRAGDLALLRALGAELGFEAQVHAVASDARGAFSSTRARDAVGSGDLDEAVRVLGRVHSVTGLVVRGDARGRTIGFPTANLDGIPELLPPYGVYAVQVDRFEGQSFVPLGPGVTSIGIRPTIVDGARVGERTVETFLIDLTADLYGERLRLNFVSRLRGEEKFASIADLKSAIAADVDMARRKLRTHAE